jgi:hypothetical protein
MAFCSRCGMSNPENSNFCNLCGAPVARILPPARTAWNTPPPPPRVPAFPAAPAYVVVRARKSVGGAILLALFFGPLGMLYSTIPGALFMLIVSLLLGALTAGASAFITWPICVVWAAVAADSWNRGRP